MAGTKQVRGIEKSEIRISKSETNSNLQKQQTKKRNFILKALAG